MPCCRSNSQVLVDAVVHAVNKDYEGMATDFVNLGFLSKGTDVAPIVPALEKIWADSMGQSLAVFNFRTVTSRFNELVFQYPIRIPARYSLVIRSLLTQEGICMTLDPTFHFLEVAYPYVAKRLLTDVDLRARLIQVRRGDTNAMQFAVQSGPGLYWLLYVCRRSVHLQRTLPHLHSLGLFLCSQSQLRCLLPLCGRKWHSPMIVSYTLDDRVLTCTWHPSLCMNNSNVPHSMSHSLSVPQVLFQNGKFRWDRLENLIQLAKEGSSSSLDLSSTVRDAIRVVLLDEKLRLQLIAAITEDNRLHVREVASLAQMMQEELDVTSLVRSIAADVPSLSRAMVMAWSDKVLSS
jgi:hypothetical protein